MHLVTAFSDRERKYTGAELRPHFLLTEMKLQGSAVGAFIGPCEVKTESLVDWEDRLAADRIGAVSMVHFLGEFFGAPSLREGVLIQRLFMAIACEEVNRLRPSATGAELCRRGGDDLRIGTRKLSVSIATASPVSLLFHAGININPEGATVPAIGLTELGVSPKDFAQAVLERFTAEMRGVEWACAKVRPVV